MIWPLFIFLAFGGVFVGLLEFGYQCGVRETEKRWFDAVKRSENGR